MFVKQKHASFSFSERSLGNSCREFLKLFRFNRAVINKGLKTNQLVKLHFN